MYGGLQITQKRTGRTELDQTVYRDMGHQLDHQFFQHQFVGKNAFRYGLDGLVCDLMTIVDGQ